MSKVRKIVEPQFAGHYDDDGRDLVNNGTIYIYRSLSLSVDQQRIDMLYI